MEKINRHLITIAILLLFAVGADAQGRRRVLLSTDPVAASGKCVLNGTYRIDVAESDRLYSVVRNARSTVPFAEQQKFFIDLSTRLTPPDMLAIECRGRRVSVGSSRASKITYIADGKNRREQLADGGIVNSKITLDRDSLTFVSVGKVDDNVNVSFESVGSGSRMRVTRRIYAKQLPEPIIIQTYYDRISDDVDWTIYDGNLLAGKSPASASSRNVRSDNTVGGSGAETLREEFADWLDATNRRDIDGQMRFYMPQLRAYYLTRNTPQRLVRLEKERVFSQARSVDVRAGEPEIILQDAGRVAIMRFVKEYAIGQRSSTRQGAVIQELRWQRTPQGWRIFSERDVRVIR